MVVSSLKPGIVTLIKDMNGNHVAQCCLQHLVPEYSEVKGLSCLCMYFVNLNMIKYDKMFNRSKKNF